MASVHGKVIGGQTYYYLREVARVGGKPKIVSQRYLGKAEDIAAAMDGAASMPARTRHLAFGDVAAVWSVLARLDVAGVIDEVLGARRGDAGASVGTYLALATLNRVVAPCSKLKFEQWWATTAADRWVKVPAAALDHRRFWDAMNALDEPALREVERRLGQAMVTGYGLDLSALALDMTNFATFIDTANDRAPIAQRGHAKQKRTDLRLVGLALVVTRDGAVPVVSHVYPGNRPDVTQFSTVIDEMVARYTQIADPAGLSVVFDAGQNSAANFAHLSASGLGWVGSLPPSGHPDLLAITARRYQVVDAERFGALSAYDTRGRALGADRRVILTHSPTLHAKQSAGFDQTLAKATAALDEVAATLARGKTRRTKAAVQAAVDTITTPRWVARVLTTTLTGNTPAQLRLTWAIDATARGALEAEIFGKRILVTNHDHWPTADVVAAYRSQSEVESGFRQLKDPTVVSFSPMFHWTEQKIRVHAFYCVLALAIAHLMRREAARAGLHLSVRELLTSLASIQETVLLYPSAGGRPKARRILTEHDPIATRLALTFGLDTYAPRT
jgi:transposase